MEVWEFLIQREGDRSWLQLESPAVEIQEGRYRLAARSNNTDTEVDVCITHQSTDEDPPKRRMQKHSRRTNSDGLMVVIPYNYLKPGIWEFCCRPDLITDLMGDTGQYMLQLQVLPKSKNKIPQTEVFASTEAQEQIVERQLVTSGVGQLTQSPIQEAQENSDNQRLESRESEKSNPHTPVFSSQQTNTYPQALQLTLDQETYMARQGRSLTVSGRVETLPTTQASNSNNSVAQPVFGGELQICLRDPQNSKVLLEMREILPAQVLPVPFTCTINIPPEINTRLILGEINLYSVQPTADTPPPTLATATFTITADVDELLSSIADNLSAADILDLRSSAKAASLDPSLNQVDTPKEVPIIRFEPSEGLSLPPLLEQSPLRKKEPKPLELPNLPSRYPPKIKTKPASSDSELDESAEQSQDAEQDSSLDAQTGDESEINLEESDDATLENADPANTSILALRAPDDFFSRLNAFATDEELSDWLQEAPTIDVFALDIEPLFGVDAEPDAHLTAMEIVVDDDPPPAKEQGTKGLLAGVPPLPEDEPIPTPKLEILPKGELMSGQKVRVRVTLPYGLPQLGVKVWLQDRQTRSLVEGPFWAGDFMPNGWEEYESTTQVTIPFGCLEIRFEAIATELQTQRESHKVSVDRTVMPPDLPTMPFNELEL